MPIYEYQCQNCEHTLEALQKLTDASLTLCPKCSHDTLKKKVSAVGFRLKGGGWYETDFKTGNKKNIAAGESTSASAANGGAKNAAASEGSTTAATSKASAKEAPAVTSTNS
jgi:putative FmdB family regulatory protein